MGIIPKKQMGKLGNNNSEGDMSEGILNLLLALHVYPMKMEAESSLSGIRYTRA